MSCGADLGSRGVVSNYINLYYRNLENTPNPLSPRCITMSSNLDTITPMPHGVKNQTSANISKEDLKVETEHYESVQHIANAYDGLIVSTQRVAADETACD